MSHPTTTRAALLHEIYIENKLKHGPGGRGGAGACDPDCRKCELERQLAALPSGTPRDPVQIGQILRSCGLPHESLALSSDGSSCRVSLERESTWTYDELALVARKLGTTDLRMEWERGGFPGSEHTPGDPDAVTLTIRWPSPAQDAAR